jgi:hypothetical protein
MPTPPIGLLAFGTGARERGCVPLAQQKRGALWSSAGGQLLVAVYWLAALGTLVLRHGWEVSGHPADVNVTSLGASG